MSRKNLFHGMAVTSADGDVAVPVTSPANVIRRGLGAQLDQMNAQAQSAARMEKMIQDGYLVTMLDPALIDESLVNDRLDFDDEALESLRTSIETNGQRQPMLVRPHPEISGRYQIVYGRRRLKILRDLGLPAKAFIRDLDDEALIVEQGQENNERANLSFIEQCLFAANIMAAGFDRSVAMSALSQTKSAISMMLQIVERIPRPIIQAIGSAPAVGRPRWSDLGIAMSDLLPRTGEQVQSGENRNSEVVSKILAEAEHEDARAMTSDERFVLVSDFVADQLEKLLSKNLALKNQHEASKAETADNRKPQAYDMLSAGGYKIGSFKRSASGFYLKFPKGEPGFAEFVADRIADLHVEFSLKSKNSG